MIIADFRVEPADYVVDFDDLHYIREEVFVVEQNIPENIEFDDLDSICFHFIARDERHNPVGTTRLSQDGKLGRMSVLGSWRNKGVGKALALNAVNKARKLGLTEISLDAQVAVVGFYEKLGFSKKGEIFEIANIPHQSMSISIPPAETISRAVPKALDKSIPATSVQSLEATLPAVVELIKNARRQLYIYTADMEPGLYGRSEVIDALKQFAISTRGSSVQIIIQDVTLVQNQAHPVFVLAHRLPSSFSFRAPVEAEDMQYSSAFVVNDRGGYLFRLLNNRYQGDWSFNLPARNRQLREEFDRIWQRSRLCTEFRALGI